MALKAEVGLAAQLFYHVWVKDTADWPTQATIGAVKYGSSKAGAVASSKEQPTDGGTGAPLRGAVRIRSLPLAARQWPGHGSQGPWGLSTPT